MNQAAGLARGRTGPAAIFAIAMAHTFIDIDLGEDGRPALVLDDRDNTVRGVVGFSLSCMSDGTKATLAVEDWTDISRIHAEGRFPTVEIPAEFIGTRANTLRFSVDVDVVNPCDALRESVGSGIFILPAKPVVSAQI